MGVATIGFDEGDTLLNWAGLTQALALGHERPKAKIADTFLYRESDTLLNRSAWIDGLGLAVKSATVFPGNPAKGEAMINGAVSLFADDNGVLEAIIDFHLVTKWKTAGDSLLAATRLARPDSRNILIIGAGTVGRSLYDAYSSAFPEARFTIWNRTRANAVTLAAELPGLRLADDLEQAVRQADIVTSATMSTDPIIRGEWLQPGQHIDVIGAYRPDMRELDDAALRRGRLYVDSRETTIGHIGELKIPIAKGVISECDIVADFYDVNSLYRQSVDDITIFKNGGGAHLDLMTSRYILDRWRAERDLGR